MADVLDQEADVAEPPQWQDVMSHPRFNALPLPQKEQVLDQWTQDSAKFVAAKMPDADPAQVQQRADTFKTQNLGMMRGLDAVQKGMELAGTVTAGLSANAEHERQWQQAASYGMSFFRGAPAEVVAPDVRLPVPSSLIMNVMAGATGVPKGLLELSPQARGLSQAGADFASSMTSPENLAFIIGMAAEPDVAVQRLVELGFTGMMAKETVQQTYNLIDKHKDLSTEEIWRGVGGIVASGAMAAFMASKGIGPEHPVAKEATAEPVAQNLEVAAAPAAAEAFREQTMQPQELPTPTTEGEPHGQQTQLDERPQGGHGAAEPAQAAEAGAEPAQPADQLGSQGQKSGQPEAVKPEAAAVQPGAAEAVPVQVAPEDLEISLQNARKAEQLAAKRLANSKTRSEESERRMELASARDALDKAYNAVEQAAEQPATPKEQPSATATEAEAVPEVSPAQSGVRLPEEAVAPEEAKPTTKGEEHAVQERPAAPMGAHEGGDQGAGRPVQSEGVGPREQGKEVAGTKEVAAPSPAPAPAESAAKGGEAIPAQAHEPGGTGAAVPAHVQVRISGEERARVEGQWQRLMRAPKDAKDAAAVEISPENAQAMLERIKAAPGDDPAARAALEKRIAPSAAEPTAAVRRALAQGLQDAEAVMDTGATKAKGQAAIDSARAQLEQHLAKGTSPEGLAPPTYKAEPEAEARRDEIDALREEEDRDTEARGGPGAMSQKEADEMRAKLKRTSTKNAIVDEERAARGQPPVMKEAAIKIGPTWEAAMRVIDADEHAGAKLVDELNDKARAVSPVEEAVMLHHKIDVMNDLERAMDRAFSPDATDVEKAEANLRSAQLMDELNDIDNATRRSGSQWSATGRMRQQVALEDYSLATMLRKKRMAKHGEALTPVETEQISKLNKRITELEGQLKAHEESAATKREDQKDTNADENIERIKKRVSKERKPKDYDPEKERAGLLARLSKSEGAEQIGSLIQKLAEHFVRNGVTERDPLVRAVHDAVKDILPDATERDIRDAISGYGKYKELSKDEVKVKLRDLKGQMQQVSKLEDMIVGGKLPSKTGMERRIPSAEERALIKEVNKVRKELGLESTDPNQLKSSLETVKTRLRNRIEDLQRAIDTQQKIPTRTRTTQDDAEAAQLRADKDALQKEYDVIFKSPKLTPEQVALKVWTTRMQKRLEDLRRRVATGDFSKVVRKPVQLDAAGVALKADVEKAKLEFDRDLYKDRLKRRTFQEKLLDTIPKWSRAFLLSNPVTLGKLTAAAAWRIVVTPLEEAVGTGIRRLPFVSDIAAHAPRQGGGLNVRAEARAMSEGIIEGSKDAYQLLRHGETKLETAVGTRRIIPHEWIDFFGQIHGALKSIPKRNEFARSFADRMRFDAEHGIDITDPIIQAKNATAALEDANRAIFQQNNFIVSRYNRFLRSLEEKSKITDKPGAKVLQSSMRTMLPIVKIPTNIVGEAFEYIAGVPIGAKNVVKAMRAGVDTLKPEQADMVMRQLKKGSLGGAIITLGALAPQAIGGYYQYGKKREKTDVKAGGVRLYGVEIPATYLHNPAIEMLQIGSTITRVAESKLRKKDQDVQGVGAGVMAAALGITSEVPFIREQLEVSKAYDPYQRGKFLGELARSRLEPQILQWIAKKMDVSATGEPIERKPTTMGEYMKSGVPGLRQQVPEKPPEAQPKPAKSAGVTIDKMGRVHMPATAR